MTPERDCSGDRPVRVEEVHGVDRLRQVAPAWDALWHRAAFATPFSSPAWLLPWCEHLLAGDPWTLLAWRGDRLAAVLPAFVYRAGPRRVVGLLGGGVSDYQDVLAEDVAAAAAVLRHLGRRRQAFDAVDLEALPPWSLLLAAPAADAASRTVTPQEVCPLLELPGRFEALASRASPRLLADVRYQRRRMAREGGFEVVAAEPSTLGSMLVDLFRLHRTRWAARGEPGVIRSGAVAAFHRDAARALLARGLLRTWALRRNGSTVGVYHGFSAHRRAYAYLPSMDPAEARHSPGSVLFAHAIEQAIAEGCTAFDFLRGGERYKYRWGAVDTVVSKLSIAHRAAREERPGA